MSSSNLSQPESGRLRWCLTFPAFGSRGFLKGAFGVSMCLEKSPCGQGQAKRQVAIKSPTSHRGSTRCHHQVTEAPHYHSVGAKVAILGSVKSHSTGRAPRRVGSDSHSTAPCPLGASSLARPTGDNITQNVHSTPSGTASSIGAESHRRLVVNVWRLRPISAN